MKFLFYPRIFSRAHLRRRIVLGLATLAGLAAIAWLGASSDNWREAYGETHRGPDYYHLLVHGFARGQLNLLVTPDPATGQDPTYFLDTAYFNGKHYLYYGVVPAVLVLLPYYLATGRDLAVNTACGLFFLLGFGSSLLWLRAFLRDAKGAHRSWEIALSILFLAFLPATTYLMARSMFYELPLMAGYAFLSVFFASLYEALGSRHEKVMLCLASIAGGLAVGCHPNLILLLVPLGVVALRVDPTRANAGARGRRILCALAPAALIGGGLAWYNWKRFGDIFDFGFVHGQNGFFARGVSVFAPVYWATNLRWYLFTAPTFTPFFPFVYPGNNSFRPAGYEGAEEMVGLLPLALLSLWTILGVLTTAASHQGGRAKRFGWALAIVALVELGFVCSLQIRANRYAVDFAAPLTLVLVAVGLTCSRAIGQVTWRRAWRIGYWLLGSLGCAVNFFGSVQEFNGLRDLRPVAFAQAAAALKVPYRLFYGAGVQSPGVAVIRWRLNPEDKDVLDPIYTTGVPNHSDTVYVERYHADKIRIGIDHFRYGGPKSEPLAVDLTEEHTIEVSFGANYPPLTDGYLDRFGRGAEYFLKNFAYITLDGQPVLSTYYQCFESPPWNHDVGTNRLTFTGWNVLNGRATLVAVKRPEQSILARPTLYGRDGALSFRAELKPTPSNVGLPLASMGVTGDGLLLFIRGDGAGGLNVCLDDWGYRSTPGSRFEAKGGLQDVLVIVGPRLLRSATLGHLLSPRAVQSLRDRIWVFVDGSRVADFPIVHHADRVDQLLLGENPQGFSTAIDHFTQALQPISIPESRILQIVEEASKP